MYTSIYSKKYNIDDNLDASDNIFMKIYVKFCETPSPPVAISIMMPT